jgi:hypothetical protein
MSWVKAISDSIEAKAPPKETLRLIQGGISAVTVQLQRAIDATDPADYPLLLAVLSMSARSFRQALPIEAQVLAQLIEELTVSVSITSPEIRKKPEGEG